MGAVVGGDTGLMWAVRTCKFCHREFRVDTSVASLQEPLCLTAVGTLVPYPCQSESSGERMVRELAQGINGRRQRRGHR